MRGLLRREVGVEDLQVDRPYLHAGLDARGQLNVADILKRLAAREEGEAPPAKSDGGVVFAVGHLRISEAQIDFTDRSRRRPFDTTVGPISLELKKFRTRRDNQSPYSFSGRTESGEKFAWSGNVLIEPIRSKGTFTFDDLQLPKYAPYYQDATGAEIRKGVLGLKATYDLEWGTERRVVKIVDGSASLRDLVVGRRDGGDPAIELPRFDVAGFHADVLTQELAITRMALEGGSDPGAARSRRRHRPRLAAPPAATGQGRGAGLTGRWLERAGRSARSEAAHLPARRALGEGGPLRGGGCGPVPSGRGRGGRRAARPHRALERSGRNRPRSMAWHGSTARAG